MTASISHRLFLVFASLLLACSGISVWLQMRTAERHEQAAIQQLSSGLAAHIAANAQLADAAGWRSAAVRELFDKLMAVNPSVEVYLLDQDGLIVAHAAPPGHLRRQRVALAPLRSLQAGAALPVMGDDPRSAQARKVFSAAPVEVAGQAAGWVYVILQGEDLEAVSTPLARDTALRMALWTTALAALLALLMGLLAFRLITRPLRALTEAVSRFDGDGERAAALASASEPAGGDEIAVLRRAFAQMGGRIAQQWAELGRQDQCRRELIANISHDLRTPLTALHGYLETLRLKDAALAPGARQRYLDIALDQSRKVGRLAQELFDLARLESGLVQAAPEPFALPELLQDVAQKFELAAQTRQQSLAVDLETPLPPVHADLGMVERVLTNLLDNAIRHTPAGTRITVRLRAAGGRVLVRISDNGPGIPAATRDNLFIRAMARRSDGSHGGGLGLLIVHRLLQLHGSDIILADSGAGGTAFDFSLPAAG
ncbi:HAMP domain-containing protein [Azoarcus indigens]|uniref:histidine kinase n=1 Tax=Azoarcus indigens TaxID=29545 RepID=A0A4R6DYY6_9RHOO|nr:HAMP domain-containing sensor histidine kinase [Azoarcus indigens]NMG67171.1 HAMP domain-containing protein [Azoarcus indigens]TDN49909.1 HAMP domain-containing protein [Azoarcus indigens]